jgi:glycosyltransferase involved in cell wall biosynthesis
MIFVIAPYSPPHLCDAPNLGAATKIELVIQGLSRISEVLLINTAHNQERRSPAAIKKIQCGEIVINEYSLPTSVRRPWGKLKNIFDCFETSNAICREFNAELIWLYNGYAAEVVLGRLISQKHKVPMVFEFEDWHFSRSRKWNPKPMVDYAIWGLFAKNFQKSYAVSKRLGSKLDRRSKSVEILPGLVSQNICRMVEEAPPFLSANGTIAGYFGGLSVEKGANLILESLPKCESHIRYIVCGAGPLKTEFEKAHLSFPEKLEFLGCVSTSELHKAMSRCDVIINPHRPLSEYGQGIFPFKIVEAIASGRVVLSTELGAFDTVQLGRVILSMAPTVESLLSGLNQSRAHFFDRNLEIREVSRLVGEHYSSLRIENDMRSLLNSWNISNRR